jgi:hypothetical protein
LITLTSYATFICGLKVWFDFSSQYLQFQQDLFLRFQ